MSMIGAMMCWIRKPRSRRFLILTHDVIVISAAFPMAIALTENYTLRQQQVLPAVCGTLLLVMITGIVWRTMRIQQSMWRYASSDELLAVVKALFVIVALFLAAMFFTDLLEEISRSILVLFWAMAFAGLCCTRIIYCSAVKAYRRRLHRKENGLTRRVLIQANMEEASASIHALQRYHGLDTDIVGIISDDAESGRLLHGIEILGGGNQANEVLASLDVTGRYPHVVVLGESEVEPDKVLIEASIANKISIIRTREVETHEFDGREDEATISLNQSSLQHKPYARAKRLIDLVSATLALFFLTPLLLIISSIIYMTDGSPVLFVQVRAGKDLRQFRLLKFRTMRPPVDQAGHSLTDDERITWFGSLLRATRADELPQFWNVIKGDMSLVGPRPLLCRDMPKDVGTLAERYCIRPGITGWAQVNGGKKIGNNTKIPLDIYYIRNFSLYFDIKIVLMTIGMLINGEKVNKNARGMDRIVHIKSRSF
jgi:exopolysaccharide biosynthesis polyprenyl glycosylphosphotransferase